VRCPPQRATARSILGSPTSIGLLLLASVLTFASPAQAADADSLVRTGREAFAAGRYEEAVSAYRALVESGHDGADVLFDLGTSALKAGRRGEAVVAFEQALLQAPNDADVAFNLAEARKSGIDQVVGEQEFEPVLERLGRAMPLGPASALFLASWSLFFALLVLRRFVAWPMGLAVAASAAAALVSGAGLGVAAWADTASRHVVVVAATAPVREGPGDAFKPAFEVHEGLKLRVLGSDDGHLRVRLANGAEGWVNGRDVVEIARASAHRTP
jgi:tetratricopeptide (TPR) repeat protein